MTLYFFHINDFEDTRGSELPSAAAMRGEALDVVRDLLPSWAAAPIQSGGPWHLSVTEEGGAEVFCIDVTARSPLS